MRGRNTRNIAVALCCVLVAPIGGTSRASAARTPPNFDCEVMDLHATAPNNGMMFCAGKEVIIESQTIVTRFFVSTDLGESWKAATAEGLEVASGSRLGQLIVSPRYADDGQVFLHTTEGIWRTSDSGESFELINAVANPGDDRLAPFVAGAGVPGVHPEGPHTAFAYANGDLPAKIDPPLHLPVAGSPDTERRFLIPPTFEEDGEAFVFSFQNNNGFDTVSLYSCTSEFACAVKLFEFPEGLRFGNAWIHPRYGETKTIYLETLTINEEDFGSDLPVVWRSTDAGRTFERWRSVNKLLEPVRKAEGFEPRVAVAVDPRRSTMFLRVSFDPLTRDREIVRKLPAEQIFRSTDNGESWKRVSFGYHYRQERGGGRIPWNSTLQGHVPYLTVAPGGRLLTIARYFAHPGYHGPYCSTDGGRTWNRTCS